MAMNVDEARHDHEGAAGDLFVGVTLITGADVQDPC
jgi:hypothetical protein